MAKAFMGTCTHTLDAKGRVFMPVKHRERLGDSVVIFKWIIDDCLYVLPESEFDNFFSDLGNMPHTDTDAKRIAHVLYSGAETVELDAQKRVLIPAEMRKAAHLDKDVAVVGVGTHVELWDLETWRARYQDDSSKVKDSLEGASSKGYKL